MTSKENIQQMLIDLVYGELSPEEESKAYALLGADEELMNEFLELKEVRSQLEKFTIEENLEQPIFMPTEPVKGGAKKTIVHRLRPKTRFMKVMYSGVAIALLLVISASILGVTFTIGNNSAQLTFGKSAPQDAGFSSAEVEAIINEIQRENLILVNKLVSDLQEEQNELIQNSLIEFVNYMDMQRTNDFAYFTMGIADLQQNTIQKFEQTDYVLDEIIKTVSTSNK